MVNLNALITDYNRSFDPKYLEILLSYALLKYHKDTGNITRAAELEEKRQPQLWKEYTEGGPDAVFSSFVRHVLEGESESTLQKAMGIMISDDVSYIPELFRTTEGISERIIGEIDPDAIRLFEKARTKGMTTGIYSRSLEDLITYYLKGCDLDGLFDHIMANRIVFQEDTLNENERLIMGIDEIIESGKPKLAEHLKSRGIDPDKTGYIDDKDLQALSQVGCPILALDAKPGVRDKAEPRIYQPKSWGEIGEILGIEI